jgi:hypothetical protein
MNSAKTDRATYHRERDLDWIASRLLGGEEAAQTLRTGTIEAREQAIQGLENLAMPWSRMSHAWHWAYCHAKHTHLCRVIERERTLLAAETLKVARSRQRAAVRQLRDRLHSRGWASVSVLRRLGKARGRLLSALAGRCGLEDAP